MCQPIRLCGVVVLGLLIASCSDSTDSDMPTGDSVVIPPVDEDDLPESETIANRSIVTEVMSGIDVIHFLSVDVSSLVASAASGVNDCTVSGSSDVSATDTGRQISFAMCQLSADSDVKVDGIVTVTDNTGVSAFEMQFTQFEVSEGSTALGIEGNLGISSVQVATIGSSEVIDITRGTDKASIRELEFTRMPNGVGSDATGNRISVSFAVALTNPEVELTVSTTDSMVSDVVACPVSGALQVVVTGGSTIDVMGGEGGNLTYAVADDTQTLACSEIESVGS